MARRKSHPASPGRHRGSSSDHTQASQTKVSTKEYYDQRYEKVAKGPQMTTLYAEVTNYHIDRMERLWREYCRVVDLDPYHTLKKCRAARIENFFHWLLRNFTVTKTSSLETYWHQLSQLYIKWKGRRMNPLTMRKIYAFINGPLVKEHELDESESDKPVLEAEDLLELLRCHWVTDTNVFPHERQRVQLATILLTAAFTGSRPGALLSVKYRDLDLFVLLDPKTGEKNLMLQLRLENTKSRQKRKRPKTYTFNVDSNPMFCVISHLIALAHDDEAYAAPDLTSPEKVFDLRVKPGLGCQPITWEKGKLDTPVFRSSVKTREGVQTSVDEALPYGTYHRWVKRLGEATGFIQVLTTYCLRRATGNAINGR